MTDRGVTPYEAAARDHAETCEAIGPKPQARLDGCPFAWRHWDVATGRHRHTFALSGRTLEHCRCGAARLRPTLEFSA